MRETIRWGIMIGVFSAAVAWLGQLLSSGKAVSLFPDLLSLITLVVFAAVALRRIVHPSLSLAAVVGSGTSLGGAAGVIIALATLARGVTRWSTPTLPLVAAALIISLVTVIAVVNVIALATFYAQNRAARARV